MNSPRPVLPRPVQRLRRALGVGRPPGRQAGAQVGGLLLQVGGVERAQQHHVLAHLVGLGAGPADEG